MTLHRVASQAGRLPLHGEAGSRLIEQAAAADLPDHTLMQRAGAAIAHLAQALAPHAERVWVASGPGNNGGDGLEAAALLQRSGRHVRVTLAADAGRLPADAAASLARAQAAGVEIALVTPDAAPPPAPALAASDIAIDALLGLGVRRAPTGALGALVQQLSALPCRVLAVDLPSGLDAATGQPVGGVAVRATHTVALLTLKPGLFTGQGRDFAGDVWLDELGVDGSTQPADAWLSGHDPAALARRAHASHKGSYGDVAVVGGAAGMTGAAVLAARAALAAGAGRVFVQLLAQPGEPMDAQRPELMYRADWSALPPDVLAASTVACGCGGGDDVRRVLPRLMGHAARLVLDADALNAVAADPTLQSLLAARHRHAGTVLTPHPLEAARLLGVDTVAVQADRLTAAQALAERFACVVVLKGSGSVIAAPGRAPCINTTGNASLASAGTGDVLGGWLAGCWAQWPKAAQPADVAFAAAVAAVAAHGAAAEPSQPGSLRAGDLVERLHARLRASA